MDNKKLEQLLLTVQKPGRYSGGEQGSVYKEKQDKIRWVLCFPDTYEIGMSHLGLKILYSALNEREDVWCERAFTPWTDFEDVSRKNNIPVFAIESRDSLSEFDIIGFTLQYELGYTNVLNMLELGRVPMLSKDRTSLKNLVVAGRCLSATHEAQASVRIMPICACMGEAAGLAIAIAKQTNTNAHTLDSDILREKLKSNGAILEI